MGLLLHFKFCYNSFLSHCTLFSYRKTADFILDSIGVRYSKLSKTENYFGFVYFEFTKIKSGPSKHALITQTESNTSTELSTGPVAIEFRIHQRFGSHVSEYVGLRPVFRYKWPCNATGVLSGTWIFYKITALSAVTSDYGAPRSGVSRGNRCC